MFARKVLNFNQQNTDRLRRLLRAYYRGFDGLFVLNREQRRWLTGKLHGLRRIEGIPTAHWAEADFIPRKSKKRDIFGVDEKTPVLLFAGRVTREGSHGAPGHIRKNFGPVSGRQDRHSRNGSGGKKTEEGAARRNLPGMVDHDRLPDVYSAADMLSAPSRFDTFGCVVLEALSCGCPVTAYNTRVPGTSSSTDQRYLVTNRHEMASCVKEYLGDAALRADSGRRR